MGVDRLRLLKSRSTRKLRRDLVLQETDYVAWQIRTGALFDAEKERVRLLGYLEGYEQKWKEGFKALGDDVTSDLIDEWVVCNDEVQRRVYPIMEMLIAYSRLTGALCNLPTRDTSSKVPINASEESTKEVPSQKSEREEPEEEAPQVNLLASQGEKEVDVAPREDDGGSEREVAGEEQEEKTEEEQEEKTGEKQEEKTEEEQEEKTEEEQEEKTEEEQEEKTGEEQEETGEEQEERIGETDVDATNAIDTCSLDSPQDPPMALPSIPNTTSAYDDVCLYRQTLGDREGVVAREKRVGSREVVQRRGRRDRWRELRKERRGGQYERDGSHERVKASFWDTWPRKRYKSARHQLELSAKLADLERRRRQPGDLRGSSTMMPPRTVRV
jgi:hypothetical protein